MRVLIAYYSDTGNTEKLARAIFDSIGNDTKQIATVDEADAEDYDVIFAGFPVQASSVPKRVEEFIKEIPEGKSLAFFVTHGSLRGGRLAITALHHALSLALKRTVLGTFGCRGEVKASIIESLKDKPEHKIWVMEALSAAGHPDEADLEDGKEFANLMIAKANRML